MQKYIYGIVSILMVPLFVLNSFGGIISGIILAIGGDWTPLLLGVVFIFIGAFIVSLLLLPSLLLGSAALYFYNKKSVIGFTLLTFISQSYIYAVIFGVSYSVFGTLLQFDNEASKFALIVWAFTAAIAPWSYLANKEKDNQGTQTTLMVAQIGLLIVVIALLTGQSLDSTFAFVRDLTIVPVLFTTWFAVNLIRNGGDVLLADDMNYSVGDYSKDEVIFFVLALIEVARMNNAFDPSELKTIRRSFRELTGEGISKKFIDRVHSLIDVGEISIDSNFPGSSFAFSDEFKRIVMKGCCTIALADGSFDKEEQHFIIELGDKLGLSKQSIKNIIKSYK